MAGPIDSRLLKRASATRGFVVGVGLVGIAQAGLVLAQATVLARSIAHVFYTRNLDGVARDAAWLILVFVGRGALAWLTDVLSHRASAAVKSQLRRDVLAARLRDPYASRVPTASLITVVTHGLDALDGYYSKYLPQFILAGIVPVIMAVAVGLRDLTSLLIIVGTIPLIPLFMVIIGWNTKERVARRFAVQTRLANHFADLVAGLPTLQVFGRARAQGKALEQTEDANRTETMGTLRLAFLSGGVLELLATLSVALVAVTIGFRVVGGGLDLATALFIIIVAPEAYLPIRLVGVHFHDSANGSAAAAAAFAIIDAAPATAASTPAPAGTRTSAWAARGLLSFDDVSYRYAASPGASGPPPPALEHLSFTLDPGELVALAGPSGAGKSTALGLALGFLTPSAGTVWADGAALAPDGAAAWCRRVAWVGQEPGLVPGTVADNIALGAPGVDRAAMRTLLDRVGGAEIALDHAVGESGEGLSAGERRRVAMARALVRIERGGARLLVLDEPTAGLDQVAEAATIDAVRAAGVAVLVVSHRPAVLGIADRIVEVAPPTPVPATPDEEVGA